MTFVVIPATFEFALFCFLISCSFRSVQLFIFSMLIKVCSILSLITVGTRTRP